jgi:hypothetical protein
MVGYADNEYISDVYFGVSLEEESYAEIKQHRVVEITYRSKKSSWMEEE